MVLLGVIGFYYGILQLEITLFVRVREAAMSGLHDVTLMLVNHAPAMLETQQDRYTIVHVD